MFDYCFRLRLLSRLLEHLCLLFVLLCSRRRLPVSLRIPRVMRGSKEKGFDNAIKNRLYLPLKRVSKET